MCVPCFITISLIFAFNFYCQHILQILSDLHSILLLLLRLKSKFSFILIFIALIASRILIKCNLCFILLLQLLLHLFTGFFIIVFVNCSKEKS